MVPSAACWDALLGQDARLDQHRGAEQVAKDEVELFASDSMAILSRRGIRRETFECATTEENGVYRVVFHKKYEEAKPVGFVGGQPCNERDRSAALEPSAYLQEGPWFACPNCAFPLRCGFLECPVCECLFLFQGESEPSQTIPKVVATLKAYAGPGKG